ncbi:MAG TPA: extracellular solute-binding protein [Candidatus Binatia bacterium]|nr:extracellular solute-binding protein [Candidatus Binatia bacterium]
MKSICTFLFALLVLSYFTPDSTLGQSASLIEAAKKEGSKVVVYGSLQDSSMEPIGKAFQTKTGLELSYWRGTATKVMDRVLAEHRAGKPLYDVILTNDNPMEIMQKEGIFAKYNSPAAKDYPDSAINPETGPIYRYAIVGLVYNNSVIKPGDGPKSLEDLLKPQFRGRLVMPDPTQDTTTMRWLESLHKVMGRERATKYIPDLAATKPILTEALLAAAERASTGEAAIAITLLSNLVTYVQKGAPMDYVRLGTMLGTNHYIVLSKRASHANAGKAFIDFFLGDESMKIMAKNGESVNRKGVYPPIPDIEKVKVIEMEDFDTNGFAEKRKEYQKIFLR